MEPTTPRDGLRRRVRVAPEAPPYAEEDGAPAGNVPGPPAPGWGEVGRLAADFVWFHNSQADTLPSLSSTPLTEREHDDRYLRWYLSRYVDVYEKHLESDAKGSIGFLTRLGDWVRAGLNWAATDPMQPIEGLTADLATALRRNVERQRQRPSSFKFMENGENRLLDAAAVESTDYFRIVPHILLRQAEKRNHRADEVRDKLVTLARMLSRHNRLLQHHLDEGQMDRTWAQRDPYFMDVVIRTGQIGSALRALHDVEWPENGVGSDAYAKGYIDYLLSEIDNAISWCPPLVPNPRHPRYRSTHVPFRRDGQRDDAYGRDVLLDYLYLSDTGQRGQFLLDEGLLGQIARAADVLRGRAREPDVWRDRAGQALQQQGQADSADALLALLHEALESAIRLDPPLSRLEFYRLQADSVPWYWDLAANCALLASRVLLCYASNLRTAAGLSAMKGLHAVRVGEDVLAADAARLVDLANDGMRTDEAMRAAAAVLINPQLTAGEDQGRHLDRFGAPVLDGSNRPSGLRYAPPVVDGALPVALATLVNGATWQPDRTVALQSIRGAKTPLSIFVLQTNTTVSAGRLLSVCVENAERAASGSPEQKLQAEAAIAACRERYQGISDAAAAMVKTCYTELETAVNVNASATARRAALRAGERCFADAATLMHPEIAAPWWVALVRRVHDALDPGQALWAWAWSWVREVGLVRPLVEVLEGLLDETSLTYTLLVALYVFRKPVQWTLARFFRFSSWMQKAGRALLAAVGAGVPGTYAAANLGLVTLNHYVYEFGWGALGRANAWTYCALPANGVVTWDECVSEFLTRAKEASFAHDVVVAGGAVSLFGEFLHLVRRTYAGAPHLTPEAVRALFTDFTQQHNLLTASAPNQTTADAFQRAANQFLASHATLVPGAAIDWKRLFSLSALNGLAGAFDPRRALGRWVTEATGAAALLRPKGLLKLLVWRAANACCRRRKGDERMATFSGRRAVPGYAALRMVENFRLGVEVELDDQRR